MEGLDDVPTDVELGALGLVRIAVNLDDCNARLARERLSNLLVVRCKAFAVAAPRRVELYEHVFAGIKHDGVKVALVHGNDHLGCLDNAHRVARFGV